MSECRSRKNRYVSSNDPTSDESVSTESMITLIDPGGASNDRITKVKNLNNPRGCTHHFEQLTESSL